MNSHKVVVALQGPKPHPRRDSRWGWGGCLPLCCWREPNQVELRAKVTSVMILWYSSEHTVTWGTNDQSRESKFKEKAVFSYDGNMTFTLTIPQVEKSDRGEYFCRADNQLAPGRSHTKTAELKVNCKETTTWSRDYLILLKLLYLLQLNLRLENSRGFPNLLKIWCTR